MRISDNEVKKLLSGGHAITEEIVKIGQESDVARQEADKALAHQVTQEVMAMGDREDMIAELKAKIQAGEYNPTGDEIADAMFKRNIADRIK